MFNLLRILNPASIVFYKLFSPSCAHTGPQKLVAKIEYGNKLIREAITEQTL